MVRKKIVVIGSGHLASKSKRRLQDSGHYVKSLSSAELKKAVLDDPSSSKFDDLKRFFKKAGVDGADAFCVLDDQDAFNIEIALLTGFVYPNAKVYVSLFNDALAEYIGKTQKNIHTFNPYSVSAPFFAEEFFKAREKPGRQYEFLRSGKDMRPSSNNLLAVILSAFILFFLAGMLFFRWGEEMRWVDALYFTTVTVGYGEATLIESSSYAKVLFVFLMLSSTIILSIFFSFLVDALMKRRYEIELGRKKYNLKDHVIVCGLGRSGYKMVSLLLDRGEKVIVIDPDEENKFLNQVKSKGAFVFVGDASLSRNLIDIGIARAAGIFVMVDDDMKSMEIGLNARSHRPDLPVVLRVFDEDNARLLREMFGMKLSFSTTSVSSEHLAERIDAA